MLEIPRDQLMPAFKALISLLEDLKIRNIMSDDTGYCIFPEDYRDRDVIHVRFRSENDT